MIDSDDNLTWIYAAAPIKVRTDTGRVWFDCGDVIG
jgi:hypothetical protein